MEVRVDLIYPKLEFVSDRTFRESLKLASRTIHAIHLSEVKYFISNSRLSSQQKQSVWDRMQQQLDHIPNYYIETVTRGGLTIVVALSAAAYFLLQNTLSKTIGAAWEKTGSHKWLVQFLSNSTTPDGMETRHKSSAVHIQNRGAQGERWQQLVREFSFRFLNQPRFGRFRVVDLTIQADSNGDMRVRITFDLADEFSELEGTFKEMLCADLIHQYDQKPRRALPPSRRVPRVSRGSRPGTSSR
jgi:hypothetical protein